MSVFGVTILKLVPIAMMGIWILHTTQMDDLMVSLQTHAIAAGCYNSVSGHVPLHTYFTD